jgi:photosynthetic reaction center H subunit
MQAGAITATFDVAQLTLYVFWGFFFLLVLYLHRENKREGYPLITNRGPRVTVEGFPPVPSPKVFHLHDGTVRYAPREEAPIEVNGIPANSFPGAPLDPTGNPMLSGMGPGAWAERPDVPDMSFDDQLPKIVPLRTAGDFFLAWEDPDPRGMMVVGNDGVVAGTISDAWIDRSEVVIRYLEIKLEASLGAHSVLVPVNFVDIKRRQGVVKVGHILGAQFADVPMLKNPDVVTFLEEEKICAYYGAGQLYSTPDSAKPLI